jgi:hypothetical protein
MEAMLPSFSLGYGDKEIFWVTATLANESFTFSPYLPGQFGDCAGHIVHYDPDESSDTVTPFYANAGEIVDDLKFVGDYFNHVITKPVRASVSSSSLSVADYRFFAPKSTLEDELKKKFSCACRSFSCGGVPDQVYRYFLLMQWLSISLKRDSSLPEKQCIPVSMPWLAKLEQAFNDHVQVKAFCLKVGCPHFPKDRKNTSLREADPHFNAAQNKYCVPVEFAYSAKASPHDIDGNGGDDRKSAHATHNNHKDKDGNHKSDSSSGSSSQKESRKNSNNPRTPHSKGEQQSENHTDSNDKKGQTTAKKSDEDSKNSKLQQSNKKHKSSKDKWHIW